MRNLPRRGPQTHLVDESRTRLGCFQHMLNVLLLAAEMLANETHHR